METKIISASICPYCGREPEYTDTATIYGKSYGMIYLCRPCDAYVGTHKGTARPLGRLANKELREWKKAAHAWFDPLWKMAVAKGRSKSEARSAAYRWLSERMGTPFKETHIGMFDVEQCKNVVAICKPFFSNKPTNLDTTQNNNPVNN